MEWLCTAGLPYLASSCILVFTSQMGLVSVAELMPGEQKRKTAMSARIMLTVCEEVLIYQLSELCLASCRHLQFENDLEKRYLGQTI